MELNSQINEELILGFSLCQFKFKYQSKIYNFNFNFSSSLVEELSFFIIKSLINNNKIYLSNLKFNKEKTILQQATISYVHLGEEIEPIQIILKNSYKKIDKIITNFEELKLYSFYENIISKKKMYDFFNIDEIHQLYKKDIINIFPLYVITKNTLEYEYQDFKSISYIKELLFFPIEINSYNDLFTKLPNIEIQLLEFYSNKEKAISKYYTNIFKLYKYKIKINEIILKLNQLISTQENIDDLFTKYNNLIYLEENDLIKNYEYYISYLDLNYNENLNHFDIKYIENNILEYKMVYLGNNKFQYKNKKIIITNFNNISIHNSLEDAIQSTKLKISLLKNTFFQLLNIINQNLL